MQNKINPLRIGNDRKMIKNFDDIDTTPAKDFSPESISVSHTNSVIIAIPVTFINKLICSVSILKTEKTDKMFVIKPVISSISNAKINTTTNIRIKKTYSGL